MPSPVGHALGGIAAGWVVSPRHDRAAAWILAAFGAAADLDLLVRDHRGPAHSVGAAAIAAAVVWIAMSAVPAAPLPPSPGLRRTGRRDRLRWSAAVGLAWASHVLLDWVGEDTWPPIGIPALWPFSRAYYQSPVVIFPSVSRQYWRHWDFVYFNAKALAIELILLVPLVWLVVRFGSARRRG